MAARYLGINAMATPVFDVYQQRLEVTEMMVKAGMSPDGKTVLYDGRTGEPFDNEVTVGLIYIIKLAHLVDDKIHARSTGVYSLLHAEPLGW